MNLLIGKTTDKRFETARDLNTVRDPSLLKTRFKNPEAWNKRAEELREQILAAAGLLPMPKKQPLHEQVSGKLDRGDYTVEKVRFESHRGFHVTGNLYRPKGDGPFPAILNTHGHWQTGRFVATEDSNIPARCANFAKQGYIAFSLDMIGYGDANQLPHNAQFGRNEKLWGISLGGLQLWNSIRALDFMETLPDVDQTRIACTGASGGGTQTFLLTAVDDRVKLSAPVCMISAHMQGGCPCENLPNLRLDTDNVEIGALMAPRPMLMVSASGDWTKDTPAVEFPAIQSLYQMLGAEEKLANFHQQAGHNYNQASREAVYNWFARWLPEKPLPTPIHEIPIEPEKLEDLHVFPDGIPPAGSLDQDGLVRKLIGDAKDSFDVVKLKSGRRLQKLYAAPLRHALGLTVKPQMETEIRGQERGPRSIITRLVLRDKARGLEIPALLIEPRKEARRDTVLMVHDRGKAGFLNAEGDAPGDLVMALIRGEKRVLLIDCFETGEHVAPEGSPERMLDEKFFDTYNRTDTAERVYDIFAALTHLQSRRDVAKVSLLGAGPAGLWCLLARAFAPKVAATVIDAGAIDITDDDVLAAQFYVPGLRRAGDFRTALALTAPGRLLLHNTRGKFDLSWAKSLYYHAGNPDALRASDRPAPDSEILRALE